MKIGCRKTNKGGGGRERLCKLIIMHAVIISTLPSIGTSERLFN